MVVVNELDASDNLVMIIFNKFFSSNFGYIIKTWITYAPDVFLEILPQAVDKTLNVLCFTELPHVLETALNPLPIV